MESPTSRQPPLQPPVYNRHVQTGRPIWPWRGPTSEWVRSASRRAKSTCTYAVKRAARGWIWLTPVFVFEVLRHGESKAIRLIELLIAVGVLSFLVRKPHRALSALIIGLPFSTIILAGLLRMGLPASLVRTLGFWKEAMVLGIALAALRQVLNGSERQSKRSRFDRADRFAFAYVALGTLYLVLPGLFVGSGPGASLSLYARELGWRSDVLYIGLFLVVRHCGLNSEQINRVFRQFVAVALIVSAVGIFEFFATNTWVRFVTKTLKLTDYDSRVLGIANPTFQEVYGTIGGHHFPRIGSVLLNYLDTGFYLALALAVGVELFTRGRPSLLVRVALPVVSVALLFNQGRAAIAAGVIAALLGLRTQIGRSVAHAERLGFAVAIALVACVPLLVTSGLAHRFVASQGSNTSHITSTSHGLHAMSTRPMGTGLATGAGGGQLAALKGLETTQTFLVTEDQYLNIGVQLGYAGFVVYVLSLLYILRALRPSSGMSQDAFSTGPAFGARNGLIGLLVAGLVLQPFSSQGVDWTVFALCGAGAAALDQRRKTAAGDREAMRPAFELAHSVRQR